MCLLRASGLSPPVPRRDVLTSLSNFDSTRVRFRAETCVTALAASTASRPDLTTGVLRTKIGACGCTAVPRLRRLKNALKVRFTLVPLFG